MSKNELHDFLSRRSIRREVYEKRQKLAQLFKDDFKQWETDYLRSCLNEKEIEFLSPTKKSKSTEDLEFEMPEEKSWIEENAFKVLLGGIVALFTAIMTIIMLLL